MQKTTCYVDEFRIIRNLGSGYHAQVELGVDPLGKKVAIKRYKKQTATLSTLQHQLQVMKALQHENVVRLFDVRYDAVFRNGTSQCQKCYAIVLEYVGGGELFDFVAETGCFSEKVARTFFNQMMNGLYYMHCKGYAHRDIKPQNVLLTADFTVKLADFGFSCLLKGKDGSGVLHTKLGTQGYMAPEIVNKEYRGTKVDIFAVGVILFIMLAGNPPFEKATSSDPYYKLLKQKNYSVFWKAHCRNRSPSFFSENFKDLFVQMVSFEPEFRPSIEQIANHRWLKGPICTSSEITNEFTIRKKVMDRVLENKKKQKENENPQKPLKTSKTNLITQKKSIDHSVFNKNIRTLYDEQLSKKRCIHLVECFGCEDFYVKGNSTSAFAVIKYFLMCKSPDYEIQLVPQPETLKILSVYDNEDRFEVTYSFQDPKTQQNEMKMTIKVGESLSGRIVVCPEYEKGNRIYYKKTVDILKLQFQKHSLLV